MGKFQNLPLAEYIVAISLHRGRRKRGRESFLGRALAREIVDDLESAIEQFRLIATDLGGEPSEQVS